MEHYIAALYAIVTKGLNTNSLQFSQPLELDWNWGTVFAPLLV